MLHRNGMIFTFLPPSELHRIYVPFASHRIHIMSISNAPLLTLVEKLPFVSVRISHPSIVAKETTDSGEQGQRKTAVFILRLLFSFTVFQTGSFKSNSKHFWLLVAGQTRFCFASIILVHLEKQKNDGSFICI